jgi:hypothetical protein
MLRLSELDTTRRPSGPGPGPGSAGASLSRPTSMYNNGDDDDDDLSALGTLSVHGAKESVALQQYLKMRKDSKNSLISSSAATTPMLAAPIPSRGTVNSGGDKRASTEGTGDRIDRFSPSPRALKKQVSFIGQLHTAQSSTALVTHTQSSPTLGGLGLNRLGLGYSAETEQPLNDTTAMRALLKTALGEKSEMAKKVETDEKTISGLKTNLAIASSSTQQYVTLLKVANRAILPRCLYHVATNKVLSMKCRAWAQLLRHNMEMARVKARDQAVCCSLMLIDRIFAHKLKHYWSRWSSAVQSKTKYQVIAHSETIVDRVLSSRQLIRWFRRWHRRTNSWRRKRILLGRLLSVNYLSQLRDSFKTWYQHCHISTKYELADCTHRLWNQSFQLLMRVSLLRSEMHRRTVRHCWHRWKELSETASRIEQFNKHKLNWAVYLLDKNLGLRNAAFHRWKQISGSLTKRMLRWNEFVVSFTALKLRTSVAYRFATWKVATVRCSMSQSMRRQGRLLTLSHTLISWKLRQRHKVDGEQMKSKVCGVHQLLALCQRREGIQICRSFGNWKLLVKQSRLTDYYEQRLSEMQLQLDYSQRDCETYNRELQSESENSQLLTQRWQNTVQALNSKTQSAATSMIASRYQSWTVCCVRRRFQHWNEQTRQLRALMLLRTQSVVHKMLKAATASICAAFATWKAKISYLKARLLSLGSHWLRAVGRKAHSAFVKWRVFAQYQRQHLMFVMFRSLNIRNVLVNQLRGSLRTAFLKWKVFPHQNKLRSRALNVLFDVITQKRQRAAICSWQKIMLHSRQRQQEQVLCCLRRWKLYLRHWDARRQRLQLMLRKVTHFATSAAFHKWNRLSRQQKRHSSALGRMVTTIAVLRSKAIWTAFTRWSLLVARGNAQYRLQLETELSIQSRTVKSLQQQVEEMNHSMSSEDVAKQDVQGQCQDLQQVCVRMLGRARAHLVVRQRLQTLKSVFSGWKLSHKQRRQQLFAGLRWLQSMTQKKKSRRVAKAFAVWVLFFRHSDAVLDRQSANYFKLRQRKWLQRIVQRWHRWCRHVQLHREQQSLVIREKARVEERIILDERTQKTQAVRVSTAPLWGKRICIICYLLLLVDSCD